MVRMGPDDEELEPLECSRGILSQITQPWDWYARAIHKYYQSLITWFSLFKGETIKDDTAPQESPSSTPFRLICYPEQTDSRRQVASPQRLVRD
jgi:hypothetical protein